MNHTLTTNDKIITCSHCSFRAIITPDRIFVTVEGDGRDIHLAAIVTQQAEQRAHVARVLNRLRNVGDSALRQRLERCVVGEFET